MPVIETLDQLEALRDDFPSHSYPRIIHQTWKTKTVPTHWNDSHQSWQRLHPNWLYVLWTDAMNEELITGHYHWFLDQYLAYSHNIQRADAVRPFILHRYGGFYSDLDIEPVKPMDEFLSTSEEVLLLKDCGGFNQYIDSGVDTALASFIRSNCRYTNMIMASKKGADFWNDVFKELVNPRLPWWGGTYHFYVMHTTGPFVIDRCAKDYLKKGYTIGHFPTQMFSPCTVCDPKPCTTDQAYVRKIEGGSWNHTDSRIITWISCHSMWIWLAIIVIVVLIIAYLWRRWTLKRC